MSRVLPEKYEIKVAVVGDSASGKSTFINCLLGGDFLNVSRSSGRNGSGETQQLGENKRFPSTLRIPLAALSDPGKNAKKKIDSEKSDSKNVMQQPPASSSLFGQLFSGRLFSGRKARNNATEVRDSIAKKPDQAVECEPFLKPMPAMPRPVELVLTEYDTSEAQLEMLKENESDLVFLFFCTKQLSKVKLTTSQQSLLGTSQRQGQINVFESLLTQVLNAVSAFPCTLHVIANKADAGESEFAFLQTVLTEFRSCLKVSCQERSGSTSTNVGSSSSKLDATSKNSTSTSLLGSTTTSTTGAPAGGSSYYSKSKMASTMDKLRKVALSDELISFSALISYALRLSSTAGRTDDAALRKKLMEKDGELMNLIARCPWFPMAYSGYSLLASSERVEVVSQFLQRLGKSAREELSAKLGYSRIVSVLQRFCDRFPEKMIQNLRVKALRSSFTLKQMSTHRDHAKTIDGKGFAFHEVYLQQWSEVFDQLADPKSELCRLNDPRAWGQTLVTSLRPMDYCDQEKLFDFADSKQQYEDRIKKGVQLEQAMKKVLRRMIPKLVQATNHCAKKGRVLLNSLQEVCARVSLEEQVCLSYLLAAEHGEDLDAGSYTPVLSNIGFKSEIAALEEQLVEQTLAAKTDCAKRRHSVENFTLSVKQFDDLATLMNPWTGLLFEYGLFLKALAEAELAWQKKHGYGRPGLAGAEVEEQEEVDEEVPEDEDMHSSVSSGGEEAPLSDIMEVDAESKMDVEEDENDNDDQQLLASSVLDKKDEKRSSKSSLVKERNDPPPARRQSADAEEFILVEDDDAEQDEDLQEQSPSLHIEDEGSSAPSMVVVDEEEEGSVSPVPEDAPASSDEQDVEGQSSASRTESRREPSEQLSPVSSENNEDQEMEPLPEQVVSSEDDVVQPSHDLAAAGSENNPAPQKRVRQSEDGGEGTIGTIKRRKDENNK
ncbi:unnamed protein product [Amoebophrya sp. A120]|nr:unnamed protein product [Amoebophrya sp. A120]|eukprot:GSA120T00017411001.1